MSDVILEVEDLRTHFRTDAGVVKAVDGVDFSLHAGEVLGIVGESGSGKTVASLSLLGLIPKPPGFHPAGSIRYRGKELLGASERAMRSVRGRSIAMIFQDPMTSLNPYLRIGRQLSEVLELHRGMSAAQARARAIELLEEVGIGEASRRVDQYPHELSGGMRQRVMIAMALSCQPDVLIADEPTTALDVTIQAQILDLIRTLQQRTGTAVILITHDLGVLAAVSDRMLVMYAGRVVEAGTTRELFADPQHPYTLALLRSVPHLERERTALEPIPGAPPNLAALPPGCPFHPRCERAQPDCREAYPPRTVLGPGRHLHCFHPGCA